MRKVRQRGGKVSHYAIVAGRAEYNPVPDLATTNLILLSWRPKILSLS